MMCNTVVHLYATEILINIEIEKMSGPRKMMCFFQLKGHVFGI